MKTMTVTKVLQKGIYLVKLNHCPIKASNDDRYIVNANK